MMSMVQLRDWRHTAAGDHVRHQHRKVQDRQGERVLRRQAGAEGRQPRHLPEPGHGADRALRLRQIDLPALPQPDERHHRRLPCDRQHPARRRRHLRPRTWTSCTCAPASAWCSRSRTLFRSRSSRTSPTDRASMASPRTRHELEQIVHESLQRAGLLEGGARIACSSRERGCRADSNSASASPAPSPSSRRSS